MNNPETSQNFIVRTPRLSIKEKVSYGLGDLASNFVWGMVTSYLLFFYTDVFGISAAAAGTLFLVTRVWDAVNDPIMGIVVDKTKSKYGKARPYLLYFAIPLGILSVATFITPDFSDAWKLVYAYFTYTLLGMVYTAINLPFGALMPMMTRDSGEKGQLNSYRALGRTIGAISVAAFTLPLATFLGNGNQRIGFPITMAIYSAIGVILFLITFKNCKERVREEVHPKNQVKVSVAKSIGHMLKNKYWVIIAISTVFWFLRLGMMNAALIYYVNYYLKQPGTVPLYLVLLNSANFVGGVLALFVLKKWGSRNSSIIMYTIATFIFLLIFLLNGHSIILFATLFFIANVLTGFGDPANLTMLGDSIDYHEWKYGNRVEGLLFSGYSFALKMGVAFGSAFVAYALGWVGYTPDHITEQATNMMRFLTFGIPIVFTALQAIVLIFYKLDKFHPQIIKELDERKTH